MIQSLSMRPSSISTCWQLARQLMLATIRWCRPWTSMGKSVQRAAQWILASTKLAPPREPGLQQGLVVRVAAAEAVAWVALRLAAVLAPPAVAVLALVRTMAAAGVAFLAIGIERRGWQR